MNKNATVVFIGWGAINAHVGALLAQRKTAIDIVGIATIDTAEARASIPEGVRFLRSPDELAGLRPDIVVEAAGRAAIDMWAEAALKAAPAMIIASTSAFCDDGLLPRLAIVAETHGSRILIPSGAIGAVDALASAAVLGLDEVTHQIVKPPVAWKGTPAEQLLDLFRPVRSHDIFFRHRARGRRPVPSERQCDRCHVARRRRARQDPGRTGGGSGVSQQWPPHRCAWRIRPHGYHAREQPVADQSEIIGADCVEPGAADRASGERGDHLESLRPGSNRHPCSTRCISVRRASACPGHDAINAAPDTFPA
jgi:hypothetical protein